MSVFYFKESFAKTLCNVGIIPSHKLAEVLDALKTKSEAVSTILETMKIISEKEFHQKLSSQINIPFMSLRDSNIPQEVLTLVSPELVRDLLVVPISRDKSGITMLMANPMDLETISLIEFHTNSKIYPRLGSEKEISAFIEEKYSSEKYGGFIQNLDGDIQINKEEKQEEEDIEDVLKSTSIPPIIRLVNIILLDAVKLRASDIHIEPKSEGMRVRFRIDGDLREILTISHKIRSAVISRFKLISGLDIAEKRIPQDGRICFIHKGSKIDIRVSSIPAFYGEKLCLRILDSREATRTLQELGMNENTLKDFEEIVSRPQGMVLVTGPTGSGKSSTLYAALSKLSDVRRNIVSVENPVEFTMEGVNQVQVNPKVGVTFATILRAFLRQDPNVIMIGEIRDSETAEIAFQAAETGHLVLATLHTQDSIGAASRLREIGVSPYLFVSCVHGVLAQRLVKRLCIFCRVQGNPAKWVLGKGCENCQFVGYKGRVGVHELFLIQGKVRQLLLTDASEDQVAEVAYSEGMKFMYEDGMDKILQGITSEQEVRAKIPVHKKSGQKSSEIKGEVFSVNANTPHLDSKSQTESLTKPVSWQASPPPIKTVTPPHIPINIMNFHNGQSVPKILAVDDDPKILELLQSFLRQEGYEVITACDGEGGLEQVYQQHPDLVITDINMPSIDGHKFIQKLQRHIETASIPVIILTGMDPKDEDIRRLALGVSGFFTKPIQFPLFLETVHRILKKDRKS